MNNEQLWQAALGELELILSRANFTTWFKNTYVIDVDNGLITIAVPNTFTKSWLEKKYHDSITTALKNVHENEVIEVIYKVETKKTPVKTVSSSLPPVAIETSPMPEKPAAYSPNDKYSFETFIVGKGNELAHAAAQAVATNPGQSYNPLFIYGGPGLGKTHLLQAVGQELRKKGAQVLYVSSEQFTNDYIQSVRAGKGREFKDQYRSVDVLLIDDIQFIAGKEGTQEEFFHTFNHLHQNNKQIMITSDRPPKAIPALEQRLLSRFEWGMIADVHAPDLETRIAILQAKALEKSLNLDPEIITYIASNIQQNVRELEGALNRIIAEREFTNSIPSMDRIKSMFSSRENIMSSRRSVSVKQLIETVCDHFEITHTDLLGKSRKRELVVPRQIIMYLMREEIQASYPTIGNEIGKRDHTTVMHACEKIKEAVETDEKIRQDVLVLRQKIYTTN